MKTTIDLPDALFNALHQRATDEGRDVTQVVTDLLAASIYSTPAPRTGQMLAPKTLPLIKLRPAPPADAAQLTTQEWCDWIKDEEVRLEVERYEKAFGHQYVDRADG